MSAPSTERMSRVDTAWLRMDSPVNRMVILGVWLLTPALGIEALRQRIGERLLRFARFRRKVVEDSLGARWVDDEAFDLARHVVRQPLRRRRGEDARAALQALVARLASEPLDPAHPLWQFHLVEHHDGGSALVARIHHCIADGIALVEVMLSLTDDGHPPAPSSAPASDAMDAWLRPLTAFAASAWRLYGSGLQVSQQWLAHPGRPLHGSMEAARLATRVVGDAGALLLMPDDSPTPLKGHPCGRKKVAWGEPLALADVKAVGKALGASVNDVLLACVAGALGAAVRSVGDDPSGKSVRAMVPVNLRPPEDAWQLGNHFGLVPLLLPIGIDNPVERVYAVREGMRALKGSTQPMLTFGLLAMAGLLVKPAQDALLDLFARKATAVMTNVPGPSRLLTVCGSTLRQTLFWVPQSGPIGVGVSILSYGGGVQFGLVTDEAMWTRPQDIVERFADEFERLLVVTLMLPWGEAA